MAKHSAGLLLYRSAEGGGIELLLVHPGGPFWARKDAGAWSIPKGEHAEGDDPEAVARREFAEETGSPAPSAAALPLGGVVQAGGKRVTAFAVPGSFDPGTLNSNRVEIEWPPRSGRRLSIPEVDRAAWFAPDLAREKLVPAQRAFVDRLLAALQAS